MCLVANTVRREGTHITMNITDKESGQNIQFLRVDKGTSLHCYYVKSECACDTCSTHFYFYIIAVKGCSFVYLRNCIFCPLSLSVMFIVHMDGCMNRPFSKINHI